MGTGTSLLIGHNSTFSGFQNGEQGESLMRHDVIRTLSKTQKTLTVWPLRWEAIKIGQTGANIVQPVRLHGNSIRTRISLTFTKSKRFYNVNVTLRQTA